MAPHITEGTSSELETFAPIYRVVIAVANERAVRADAEPKIPKQTQGYRISVVGARGRITPGFGAPGVDFFDLTNGAGLDQKSRHAVMTGCMNLNAHLSYQSAIFEGVLS